ncbi:hypothetical protein F5B17DRAFT_431580 [Nemania serpens]|nr:hypothetical protein F5B17DRAFT_431580 [Nemania serpens]
MCEPSSEVANHEETETDWSIYFNRLPPELRHLIWKEAALTAMDNPEVLILLPRSSSLGILSLDKSSKFPPVNTGFPAVMHVNREARRVALLHIDMVDLGPLWNKCPVPQRPFRPDIDTLYASLTQDPFLDFCEEELVKVQHLALDYPDHSAGTRRGPRSLARRMPALRTLRLVLTSMGGIFRNRDDLPFLPHRRCALRPITLPTFGPQTGCTRGMKPHPFGAPPCRAKTFTVNRATTANPEAPERVIKCEVCVITEFCYSPSGDSRFVAAGEKFPESPDPNAFATFHAGAVTRDRLSARFGE